MDHLYHVIIDNLPVKIVIFPSYVKVPKGTVKWASISIMVYLSQAVPHYIRPRPFVFPGTTGTNERILDL